MIQRRTLFCWCKNAIEVRRKISRHDFGCQNDLIDVVLEHVVINVELHLVWSPKYPNCVP